MVCGVMKILCSGGLVAFPLLHALAGYPVFVTPCPCETEIPFCIPVLAGQRWP